jgi:branched-chain amino acid transport system substrate-binding protein
MLKGAELAAQRINANGGFRNKQIEIVPIDDAATSSVGIAAAQAAVKSKLSGVIGPYNSGVGIYTLPIYLDAGLLPIRLTSNNLTDAMGYTLQPMSDEIAPMAADAITTWQQASSVGILYDSTQTYTTGLADSLKTILQQRGVTISAYTGILPGQDNYSSAVETMAALNPDIIYAATYFPEGGLISKAMYEQSEPAQLILDYGSDDPGFIAIAGLEAAMHTLVVGVPSPTDFPHGPEFAARYEDAFGEAPGTWSPYTYDSLNLLVDAAKTVGSFQAKKLKPILDGTDFWLGVTGSVTIDPATGNRVPATLVMLRVDGLGNLVIDQGWADAVGAPY